MSAADGEPLFLYLTTKGRRSGAPRDIEIWFTQHQGRYYVIAEHGNRAQWVRNIMAHPGVSFRVGEQSFAGQGRVVDSETDPHLHRTVQRLSEAKYGWGDGLVVELTPD